MAEILTDSEIAEIQDWGERRNPLTPDMAERLIASHRALAADRDKLKSALEEIAGSHFANEFHDGTPTGPAAIEHLHRIANKALKVEQLEGAIKHG